jgi:hypothetical protein
VIPRGVQIADDAERRDFLAFVEEAGPFDLIVFDTLARCAVGLDENSARDIGLFVDGLGEISRASDATVLVVHHTGKDRATVRGSSALESGMDTVYTTEADETSMALKRTKRKDGRTYDDHRLRLQEVGPSVVVRPLDEKETPDQPEVRERVFSIIWTHFGERPATRTEIIRVLRENGIPRSSAYTKTTELDAMEVLVQTGEQRSGTVRWRLDLSAAKDAGLRFEPIGPAPSGPDLSAVL